MYTNMNVNVQRSGPGFLVLFLVSSDFISSPEYYEKEVLPAMDRYYRGENRVIPIILRPVLWQGTAFGKLPPLPEGGRPVTDSSWTTKDHAFVNVVSGIKRAINDEKNRLSVQQENPTTSHNAMNSARTSLDASTDLDQIIQDFKTLRAQIANFASMKGSKEFSLLYCDNEKKSGLLTLSVPYLLRPPFPPLLER